MEIYDVVMKLIGGIKPVGEFADKFFDRIGIME